MKRVEFDTNKNVVYSVYSREEYDRWPIDSILYQRSLRRISNTEWQLMIQQLNFYKQTEMVVHNESVTNTKFNY